MLRSNLGSTVCGYYWQTGMSDPNKWYDRRNGNSHTVKITFFRTGLIILPSLGKLFHLIYFPKIFTDENDGKVKKGAHRL
jgi:hypothetical protein